MYFFVVENFFLVFADSPAINVVTTGDKMLLLKKYVCAFS